MNSKALYKLTYGLHVVGSFKGDKINAQIANTVIQITSEPATVAVSGGSSCRTASRSHSQARSTA